MDSPTTEKDNHIVVDSLEDSQQPEHNIRGPRPYLEQFLAGYMALDLGRLSLCNY